MTDHTKHTNGYCKNAVTQTKMYPNNILVMQLPDLQMTLIRVTHKPTDRQRQTTQTGFIRM